MTYTLSPGHRVVWCHDFTETKAQITRIWKTKAEIVTADFQRLKVPLDELELAPVVEKKSDRWNPDDFGEVPRQTEEDGQGLIFFDTSDEPPDPDDFSDAVEYAMAWSKWARDRSVRERTLTDSESVREQTDLHPNNCTLTTEDGDRCTLTEEKLHPNSWIEEKMIARSGKLHGPYRYERWRDPATGKMKSRYLGRKA